MGHDLWKDLSTDIYVIQHVSMLPWHYRIASLCSSSSNSFTLLLHSPLLSRLFTPPFFLSLPHFSFSSSSSFPLLLFSSSSSPSSFSSFSSSSSYCCSSSSSSFAHKSSNSSAARLPPRPVHLPFLFSPLLAFPNPLLPPISPPLRPPPSPPLPILSTFLSPLILSTHLPLQSPPPPPLPASPRSQSILYALNIKAACRGRWNGTDRLPYSGNQTASVFGRR